MNTAISPAQRAEYERALNIAFSPHTPINKAQFFKGRTEQIRAVTDTIRTPGLHAAIYGERGVGKTSLAKSFRTSSIRLRQCPVSIASSRTASILSCAGRSRAFN
jgi:transcriptional regulator with AAA-type ATPase domain